MDIQLDLDTAQQFALALLIGALVGIEREKKMREGGSKGLGGLRTFVLFAMAGAISAWLAMRLDSAWILGAGIVSVALLVCVGYWGESQQRAGTVGLTTEIAALCVTLLGALCVTGFPVLAVALGILCAALLAFKEPLHGAVDKLGREDIYAGLKLLIASFIVLPVLPDRTVDPWDALNPYTLWLLVVLISGLSLVGYVAIRLIGPSRGTAVAGLAGGMVSSTAATVSLARQSRAEGAARARQHLMLTAVMLAWVVMSVRVVVEVAVVNRRLVPQVAVPMAAMALATLAVAAYAWWRARSDDRTDTEAPTDYRNPFSLWMAIRFAAVFAAVLVAVALAREHLPPGSVYVVAALAGLTNVDAITLTLAQGGDQAVAVRGITIAALANTAAKCGLYLALGSRLLRAELLAGTALVLAAGAGSLLLVGT